MPACSPRCKSKRESSVAGQAALLLAPSFLPSRGAPIPLFSHTLVSFPTRAPLARPNPPLDIHRLDRCHRSHLCSLGLYHSATVHRGRGRAALSGLASLSPRKCSGEISLCAAPVETRTRLPFPAGSATIASLSTRCDLERERITRANQRREAASRGKKMGGPRGEGGRHRGRGWGGCGVHLRGTEICGLGSSSIKLAPSTSLASLILPAPAHRARPRTILQPPIQEGPGWVSIWS